MIGGKLENSQIRRNLKNPPTWISNGSTKKSKEKYKKFKTNNKKSPTIYQNLWDAAEAVLRGKFIVINGYIKTKG